MNKDYLQTLVTIVKDDVRSTAERAIPHRFWSEFDELLDIELNELAEFSRVLELNGVNFFDEKEKHQNLVDEIFTLFEQKINRHLGHTTIPKRLYSKVYQIIDDENTPRDDYKNRVEYRLEKLKEEKDKELEEKKLKEEMDKELREYNESMNKNLTLKEYIDLFYDENDNE